GAEEIEEGICIKIEEAVQDLEGIKRLKSTAVEGLGVVTIELEYGLDPADFTDKVRTRVDAIDTFPEETEKPAVREVEPKWQVLNLAVYGTTDEASLKRVTERIRDELSSLPSVSQVTPVNMRAYEISVEVSEDAMRRYGLSFDDIVAAVRRGSVELSGGSLKTEGGEILVRTAGRARAGLEFESIPVKTLADGSRLLLRQVADVVDGFEDKDLWSRFDGRPALTLSIFRSGDQSVLEVARAVHEYVEKVEPTLPPGIHVATYTDNSRILRGRLNLLVRNGMLGLGLAFIALLLFFRFRLAFWVVVGLPTALLGAFWLLPMLDVTINLMSLFAFVLVLGILVDDAIVVSENVFRHNQEGRPPLEAATLGTTEVMLPVFLAVSTNIVAFIPMLLIPGVYGDFAGVIPKVVIPCMVFSLVESLFILPAHLARLRVRANRRGPLARVQDWFGGRLDWFVRRIYRPVLRLSATWRYATLAAGAAALFITVGLVGGGALRFTFFPPIEADFAACTIVMPQGTTAEATDRVVRRLEQALEDVRREVEGDAPGSVLRHVASTVGAQPAKASQDWLRLQSTGGYLAEIFIELRPSEERSVRTADILRRWREKAGPVPDAKEISFSGEMQSAGKPIDIQLSARDMEALAAAAAALKEKLGHYPGVYDITDSFVAGKRELQLGIKPGAEAAGLSEADLARQVRQAFYGQEAQSFQRGREEVKVMVRYPGRARRSLADVHAMHIRAAGGVEVPFSAVAEVRHAQGPAVIQRAERRRSVSVSADVDLAQANANAIVADLQSTFLPELTQRFAGLRWGLEGEQREQQETLAGIARGLVLALLMIYTLIAVPFRSYLQPAIIMLSIPFGLAGAVWAHYFLGMDLTFMSFVGALALTGVVVNDAIVMIDFINRSRQEGQPLVEAILRAGPLRFRPILLTTLTTFVGMAPMIMEKSMQAQFLIPMAVSLAFGLVFATGVTLVIVPCAYLVVADVQRIVKRTAPTNS
ncbi:MAG: efflux RND transporter permease subunit, partial [Planctomycetes bacterium]|nr:efflux RND transporter permease subunit [Planctomycetota bacterium]